MSRKIIIKHQDSDRILEINQDSQVFCFVDNNSQDYSYMLINNMLVALETKWKLETNHYSSLMYEVKPYSNTIEDLLSLYQKMIKNIGDDGVGKIKEIFSKCSDVFGMNGIDEFFEHNNIKHIYHFSPMQSEWVYIILSIINSAYNQGKCPETATGVVALHYINGLCKVESHSKIMRFLLRSFPNMTFVISTNSPYVLQSLPESSIVIDSEDLEISTLDFCFANISQIVASTFQASVGFSKEIEAKLQDLRRSLVEDDKEVVFSIIENLYGKSQSLDSEITRLVMISGSVQVICRFNEDF